ncbi:tyrosine-type recombinase/integrase [Streptosporangium oxazolinicum]|uniref:tyrosine-type recombinase/integrase n=1 Tax=Streptosporangium oxazolinicum TaxID=909287 RepID=UPI0031E783B7
MKSDYLILNRDSLIVLAGRRIAERSDRWDDWEEHGLVFPSRRGTPMEPDNLRRSWGAIRKAAGLGDMRFHDLRHTCAQPRRAAPGRPRHRRPRRYRGDHDHLRPCLPRRQAQRLWEARRHPRLNQPTVDVLSLNQDGTSRR